MQNTIQYRQARRQVARKLRFYFHLTIYLTVNCVFILLHQYHHDAQIWSFGPLVGWGIGLLFHGLAVVLRSPYATWKQRMINNELNKGHS
jgi:hypothetical protein